MSIRFPWQKKVSDAEVLTLALKILFEKAGSFSSEEEMRGFLRKDLDRPQHEHDEEIKWAMREARRQLEGII